VPTPQLTTEQLQEAVDLVAKWGGVTQAAQKSGIPRSTLLHRNMRGCSEGLKPTQLRYFPEAHVPERLGRVHMVIPDVQAKPNVDHDHMEWIANYALEKRPDVIVQIGDWYDMPSLSLYDKGKKCYEGRRYVKDIEAGNYSLERFERTLEEHNRAHPEDAYNPRKVHTRGNHENRIVRATELDAALDGKLTVQDMDLERRGWECFDFLDVVKIDGIEYSHYFISGNMGRPVSTAAALLRARNGSATMGHVQNCDLAIHKQTQHMALFAGICYTHDETYLGPQGNATRRQIIMKHEVEDGRYDPMFVSLRYLKKKYS
jgi:hypothetical protein